MIVLHVSPPNVPNYPIIASNIGRIGKIADDDDMRVITTEKTNLEIAHGGKRFEVELVLRDVAGTNLGALGLVFVGRKRFVKRADRVVDRLFAQIPQKQNLQSALPGSMIRSAW